MTGFEPATPHLGKAIAHVLNGLGRSHVGRSRRSELRRRTSQDASERRGTGGVSPKCHPTRELLADHESHDQGCPWGGFLSPLNTSLDR